MVLQEGAVKLDRISVQVQKNSILNYSYLYRNEMNCSASELDELICNKTKELEKLNDEYKVLSESRNYFSDSEIMSLNSELCNLMAEVKVLKKCEPEIMPKCDSFLYAWAQHSLEESIKEKEQILFNLDKLLKESSKKRKLLVQRCPNIFYEHINRKMLEDARSKNELLHCFHKKMVRRLRRLSRRFPTLPRQSEEISKSTRDITGKVLTRSFYRVLKEFVLELQDRTFKSDNWDQSQPVFIDQTYCKEHIKILCNTNIIQKSTKNPPSYYLTSSITKSDGIMIGD